MTGTLIANEAEIPTPPPMTSEPKRRPCVLCVMFDFPPTSNAAMHRNLATVRAIAEAGWHPVVLTVHEDQKIFPHRDFDLLDQVPAEATVIRTKMIDPYDNALHHLLMGQRSKVKQNASADAQAKDAETDAPPPAPSASKRARAWLGNFLHGLMLPDRFMGWLPYAIAAGKRAVEEHRPDVILSTSPCISGQVVASRLVRRAGVPWIADYQDPWTKYAFAVQRVWPLSAYERRMERRYLERADAVVVNAAELRDEWRRTHPHLPEDKFEVIYWAHHGVLPDDQPAESFDKFTLAWTGTLYDVPVHRDLLEGLRRALEQRPAMRERFRAVFLGMTDPGFRALVHEFGLRDVIELRGQRPQAECTRVLMGADAAYYSIYHHNQISCKLFEYLRTRVPILGILPPDHEVHGLMRDTGAPAFMAHEGDPAGVAEQMLEMFDRWEQGTLRRPDAARAADQQRAFTYEHTGQQFIDLIQSVLDHARVN